MDPDEENGWMTRWVNDKVSMLRANFPGESLQAVAKHLADQHNPVAYVKSPDFAPEYVSCEYHTAYSNPGFIAKLQAMGVKVALWTVDTEGCRAQPASAGAGLPGDQPPGPRAGMGGRKSVTQRSERLLLWEKSFAALDKQGQWDYNSLISNSFIENSLSKNNSEGTDRMCDEKQNECRDHGDPPWRGRRSSRPRSAGWTT